MGETWRTLRAPLWPLCAALALAPGAARADAEHTHDGVLLRGVLGIGYQWISDDGSPQSEIVGAAAAYALQAGYMLTENIGLVAELSGDRNVAPRLSVGGVRTTARGGRADTLGLGAGATFSFTDLNLLFAATLLRDSLTLENDGESLGRTEAGLGLHLLLGREWWIRSQWAMGTALAYRHTSVGATPPGGGSVRFTADTVQLVLTATFN